MYDRYILLPICMYVHYMASTIIHLGSKIEVSCMYSYHNMYSHPSLPSCLFRNRNMPNKNNIQMTKRIQVARTPHLSPITCNGIRFICCINGILYKKKKKKRERTKSIKTGRGLQYVRLKNTDTGTERSLIEENIRSNQRKL